MIKTRISGLISTTLLTALVSSFSLSASPVLSVLAQQHSVGVILLGGGVESIGGQRVESD